MELLDIVVLCRLAALPGCAAKGLLEVFDNARSLANLPSKYEEKCPLRGGLTGVHLLGQLSLTGSAPDSPQSLRCCGGVLSPHRTPPLSFNPSKENSPAARDRSSVASPHVSAIRSHCRRRWVGFS
jgi:predicted small lipoprotein YifL